MADPPVLAGAVQFTMAEALPRSAETPVGTPGVVAGVTDEDGLDSTLLPSTLVACTVKLYDVPLVSPVTEQGLEAHDTVAPPGETVTV